MLFLQLNPVAINLGPLKIYWYGLMYLFAFMQFFVFGYLRIKKKHWQCKLITFEVLENLFFNGALGVLIGGRLGYVFFYLPNYYLQNPITILKIWEGGMSFHGGLIGVMIMIWIMSKKNIQNFLKISDFVAPLVPLGLFFGRFGNFVNGELWGRPSNLPWAMIFPNSGDLVFRHPSQLYQMGGEGILLWYILWIYSSKPRRAGSISGIFLLFYGTIRFLIEYTREPDIFLGLLYCNFSMGQWLSFPMMAIGMLLLYKNRTNQNL